MGNYGRQGTRADELPGMRKGIHSAQRLPGPPIFEADTINRR